APIGYVSFTAKLCEERDGDWQQYGRWWKDPACRIVHFVGEDNTIFHALTWPAMLLGQGTYQAPWQVVVNAFLNIKFPGQEEQKISKSRGAAIWIEEYLKAFDPDPLRYYLTAIAPENQRTAFDVDDFVARNNNELVNVLGNFVNRTVTFAERYFEAKVPEPGQREPIDIEHLAIIAGQVEKTGALLDAFKLKAALAEVMVLARAANRYFDAKEPWNQRKNDMPACGTTINVCIQTVKALTTLMAPFLPFSAVKCLKMLGLGTDALTWDEATREVPAGHALGRPAILFKKLDPAALFAESD
ncbi:MAG TPA: class I tRNA ligase family protein, partial [Candidatus Hydrogenedentes bacterium]|nr:class I tRNA ligase family protein [Candidatus Hydrogenedentota bacterium]